MDNKRGQEDIAAKKLQQNAVRGGLNLATGGKYEYLRNTPVAQNAAKKVEDVASNKLNNIASKSPLNKSIKKSINADKINKTLGRENSKIDDAVNQKLKNVKKSRGGRLNNLLRRNGSSSSNEDSIDENNLNEEDDTDEIEEIAVRRRILKIIISIMSFAFPFLVIIFMVIAVMYFLSSTILKPFVAIMEFREGSQSANEYMVNVSNSSDYAKEKAYYGRLNEANSTYAMKCKTSLNTNYIHAPLIYLYYQIDYSEELEESNIYIDYGKMTSMIDSIYFLMTNDEIDNKSMEKEDLERINCNIDYDIGGELYNSLLTSSKLRGYYSDLLEEDEMDDILSNVFDLAGSIDLSDDIKETNVFISPKLKVNYNGLNINAKDYLTGVIYNKLSKDELNNGELIKAYTVYYTTNTVYNGTFSNNKLTLSLNGDDYCDINSDCNGKGRITETEKSNIKKNVDSVYGNVLLNNSGGLTRLNNDLSTNKDYKTILTTSYPNYKVANLLENTYDTGTTYGNNKVLTKAIFYDQNDYGNVNFCGRSNATIKSSGCGTTAMAIIVSTYQNSNKYDPVYEMNRAYKWGYCGKGISGTNVGFFKKEAKAMGYKYLKVGKSKSSDLNLVLSHLSKGDLVIAHMGAGHFTSGGHYMVLGGVDPSTKKVYVYDPYNKSNKANKKRRTGNGWYSLNDMIAKEAFAFYIIWKG